MITADTTLGEFVVAATSKWVSPNTDKESLEFGILVAELDWRNYSPDIDPPTGKQVFTFGYPPDITAAIATFEQDNSRLRQALTFPLRCREILNQTRMLDTQEAERVASLMAAVDGDEEINVDEEMMDAPRVAAAAVLLLRAPEWLAQNVAVGQRAQSIIDGVIVEIADKSEARGSRILMAPSHLEFAAYFAFERWIHEPSKENDERVLRILMSGDDAAVQVLVWSAYRSREALGQRWWRLLYLALLWSGLLMLTPHYGDENGEESPLEEMALLASNARPVRRMHAVFNQSAGNRGANRTT